MYKVEYTISGYETVFYAGPYKTYDLAMEHKRDIEIYEGTENVSVVPVEKKKGKKK